DPMPPVRFWGIGPSRSGGAFQVRSIGCQRLNHFLASAYTPEGPLSPHAPSPSRTRAMRALAGVLLPALLPGFVNVHAHNRAQVSTTAAIVAQSPCQFTTFEEQTPFARRFYSKAEYERAKTNALTECLRIQYLSDGLKVVGFLVKPRDPQGRRYPVIIYNRRGVQDIGKIDAPNILDFYELAA